MRGIEIKATAPKKMNGAPEPRSNKPVDIIIPPKNAPAHNVKKNCSGNCTSNVIQPMKTGRTENSISPDDTMASPVWSRRTLHQHHYRVLDQRLEGADQHGAERAVDSAVVAAHGHAHDLRGDDLAVAHHRALLAGADRKNGGVRRIDHRGEILNPVHAEVRHRRSAALIVVRFELAVAGARREV